MRQHGGDIYSAIAESGGQEVLDFSASINPLGMPESAKQAYLESLAWLPHYPDPEVRELRSRLAEHHGTPAESILCGNGSAELISLLPRALQSRKVLALAPTFSEYERAVSLAGGRTFFHHLDPDRNFDINVEVLLEQAESADMILLCNPNNPTGRMLRRPELLKIAAFCSEKKIFLTVDETFEDFCPGNSIVSEAAEGHYLISLRSFTKFYAMPGLRLGYMVAHPSVVERVRELQDTWSVCTPAQRAGIAALGEMEFGRRTLALVEEERDFLTSGLAVPGWLEPLPSSANFILVKITNPALDSDTLCGRAAREGVLIRNCRSFKNLGDRYIRVAVRTRPENERLLAIFKNLAI